MKRTLLLIVLIVIPPGLFGQKIYHGKIDANTHWSGQILLDGDVIVSRGTTLSIEAGSRIMIKAHEDQTRSGKDPQKTELVIMGRMLAIGENGPGKIVFSTNSRTPQRGDWHGIIIKNNSLSSVLKNCEIEYAYKGITCYGSFPEITGCEIRFNYYAGISCEVRAAPVISQCVLMGNDFAGIICELASNPVIQKSIITQNSNGIIIFDRSKPDLGQISNGLPGGENRIFDNFGADLDNHSSEDIFAQNNFWNSTSPAEIREKLVDKEDNQIYGTVIFQPLMGASRPFPADTSPNRVGNPDYLAAPNASGISATMPPMIPLQNDSLPDSAGAAIAINAGDPVKLQPDSTNFAAGDSLMLPMLLPMIEPAQTTSILLADRQTIQDATEYHKTGNSPENPAPDPDDAVLEALLDSGSRHYVQRVKPQYPEIYRRAGHEGKVLLEVIVGRNGNVESYRVLRSDGELFTLAALAALQKMQYQPETFKGEAVRFKIVEPFLFKLSPD